MSFSIFLNSDEWKILSFLEASEIFVFMQSYKEDFNAVKKTLIAVVSPRDSHCIGPEHLHIAMCGFSEHRCTWVCYPATV